MTIFVCPITNSWQNLKAQKEKPKFSLKKGNEVPRPFQKDRFEIYHGGGNCLDKVKAVAFPTCLHIYAFIGSGWVNEALSRSLKVVCLEELSEWAVPIVIYNIIVCLLSFSGPTYRSKYIYTGTCVCTSICIYTMYANLLFPSWIFIVKVLQDVYYKLSCFACSTFLIGLSYSNETQKFLLQSSVANLTLFRDLLHYFLFNAQRNKCEMLFLF